MLATFVLIIPHAQNLPGETDSKFEYTHSLNYESLHSHFAFMVAYNYKVEYADNIHRKCNSFFEIIIQHQVLKL